MNSNNRKKGGNRWLILGEPPKEQCKHQHKEHTDRRVQ